MSEETIMTKQQAIDANYEKWGYNDHGWQTVNDISDLCADDFEHGVPVVFIRREYHPSIDADTIREMIAEHVGINHRDQTGDDTDTVYDSIMELDFESTAKMVNDKMTSHIYYLGSNINLTL